MTFERIHSNAQGDYENESRASTYRDREVNAAGEVVHVGRSYGGRHLTLDRAEVTPYVGALEIENPLYESVVPGLLLHSECYEDLSWYLAKIYGNLHARQEWELYAEIPLGARVSTRSFIRERYRKRGRDYVVKETWVLDEEGALLSRGITHQSFLVEDEARDETGNVVDKKREKSRGRRFDIDTAGATPLEPLMRTVSDSMCMAFSGPEKNYHTDREAARKLGFPDIVVQGMLPICLVSELLTRDFGRGWLAGGKMDVRLVNVLWAGEDVRVCAQVTDESPEGDRTRAHLDVWVEKADGTKVIIGRSSALRP